MLIENLSIVLSAFACMISLFSSLLLTSKKRMFYNIKLTRPRIKIEYHLKDNFMKNPLYEVIKSLSENNIEACLEDTAEWIKKLYPKAEISVSIKLIEGLGEDLSDESNVYQWCSYPSKKNNTGSRYSIKGNTDFHSILDNKSKYFFVTDLKEYCTISEYKNEDRNFNDMYGSSIVCPIRKKENNKTNDIIGFLCIDSPQRLNNVKKNKKMMDHVMLLATTLYSYIMNNKNLPGFLSPR